MAEATANAAGRPAQKPSWVKDLGFTTLFEPQDRTPIADIVFVHGLQGHPWRTWRYKGQVTKQIPITQELASSGISFWRRKSSSIWKSESTFGRTYWPADLLPLDQPDVRILTYGYDSRVTNWFGGAANQMNLEQHGSSFLNALEAERRKCRGRPILFIAHSLGGLVVKEAINSSFAEQHHSHLRDISDSPHAIVFFGTPHRGSKDASWGILLKHIANAALFDTNDAILRELDPRTGSDKLNMLNDKFANIVYEKGTRITTFQEAKGKAGTVLLHGKVVPNESSSLNLDQYEIRDSIVANHMDMCRFALADDDGYIKAKNAVAFHVHGIDQVLNQQKCASTGIASALHSGSSQNCVSSCHDLRGDPKKTAPTGEELHPVSTISSHEADIIVPTTHNELQKEISRTLYFPEISSRKYQIYDDEFDTNSWIWSEMKPKESFVEWLSSDEAVYWMTGLPGSGKSTLVKYIMGHSRTQEILSESFPNNAWRIMGFFFDFRAGKALANSFEGLLRSLLLQLLREIPGMASTIRLHGTDELDPDLGLSWNASKLRSSFLTCLKSCKSNFCIFVDGLDEYEGSYLDLVDLFKVVANDSRNAQNCRVKLCLASRPEPIISEHLKDYPGLRMQSYNCKSITGYVSKRLECIMKTDSDVEVRLLINDIGRLANGVFLWARFAADDLLENWAHGQTVFELQETLYKLPPDLDAMYTRILGRIKAERRYEASIMLRLVCYAQGPLKWKELSDFVRVATCDPETLIMRPNIKSATDFQRKLEAYTGGLLEALPRPSPIPLESPQSVGSLSESDSTSNDIATSDAKDDTNLVVKLLHKTLKNYLERPGWIEKFCTTGRKDTYHGTELWLHVIKKIVEIPDTLQWPKTKGYLRWYLGDHARDFEDQTNRSSFPLLNSVITDENVRSLKLADAVYVLGELVTGTTALSVAASSGLLLFCEDKIKAGADVNAHQGRALLAALIWEPHARMMKSQSIITLLLDHRAIVKDKHIVLALNGMCHSVPILRHLLKDRRIGRLQLWSDAGRGFVGPLYLVARQDFDHGSEAIMSYFLENGEDINRVSGPMGTPLHGALGTNFEICLDSIKTLVRLGADVNAEYLNKKPLDVLLYRKWSPRLHWDGYEKLEQTSKYLIRKGAVSNYASRDEILRALKAHSSVRDFRDSMKRAKLELLEAREADNEENQGP